MKDHGDTVKIHDDNLFVQAKYNITAWFYDILDYPFERLYRKWRPVLLKDIRGSVLEAGVGTGRNLKYYHPEVELTGIDISRVMLRKAAKRAESAACIIKLMQGDATLMDMIPSNQYDWVVSTFLCCVMPDKLQPLAIEQFERVLKPGGKFKLLEMVYSNDKKIRKRQEFVAPFVEKVYGARFDRNTLKHIEKSQKLRISKTEYLKDSTYLVIEGDRID